MFGTLLQRAGIWWEAVRASYWFVPTLMLAGAGVLAFGMITIDQRVDNDSLRGLSWMFGGGADGARSVLSTIAGSVVTVAGVVFSITIAALSLTSQQFGPRLLRTFLRDAGNQVALGTFLATFLYCLIVLRTVRGIEEVRFVPHVAVTAGQALGVVSVFVLVYFIHNVSSSIQAGHVVRSAARELEDGVSRLFPDPCRAGAGAGAGAKETWTTDHEDDDSGTAEAVPSWASGYVQTVDADGLLRFAAEQNLVLEVRHRPGRFVAEGAPIARVRPPERAGDPEVSAALRAAVSLGETRLPVQDIEFSVQQLVEMAVRSLSPGVNDPFTAVECLDRLGAALARLAGRAFPESRLRDEGGRLRVVLDVVRFDDLLGAMFDQIDHYAGDAPLVRARLAAVQEDVAEVPDIPEERRTALRRRAALARAGGEERL